jgi:hypothetical protein
MYVAVNNEVNPRQKPGERYTDSVSKMLRLIFRHVSSLDPHLSSRNDW